MRSAQLRFDQSVDPEFIVPQTCAARLRERKIILYSSLFEFSDLASTGTSHPTIKSPEEGLSVPAHFASNFQYPLRDEGQHHIIYLRPSDNPGPNCSRSDVAKLLQRVRDSVPVTPTGIPWPLSSSYRLVRQRDTRREGMRGTSCYRLNDTENSLLPSARPFHAGGPPGAVGSTSAYFFVTIPGPQDAIMLFRDPD